MRDGSGMRASAENSGPLTMSPRYEGSVTPPCVSVSEDRGLANCPAMRPIFTTGSEAPNVSTTAICNSTRNVSRMMLAVKSEKLSAQSPPCSTNALPSAAVARCAFSRRASPANTRGGYLPSRASMASSFAGSGYVGTWRIGQSRQESGVQLRAGMVSGICGLLRRGYVAKRPRWLPGGLLRRFALPLEPLARRLRQKAGTVRRNTVDRLNYILGKAHIDPDARRDRAGRSTRNTTALRLCR